MQKEKLVFLSEVWFFFVWKFTCETRCHHSGCMNGPLYIYYNIEGEGWCNCVNRITEMRHQLFNDLLCHSWYHMSRLHQMYFTTLFQLLKFEPTIYFRILVRCDNSFWTRSFTLCWLKGFYFCDALNRAHRIFLSLTSIGSKEEFN